jgi:hypothetical protein
MKLYLLSSIVVIYKTKQFIYLVSDRFNYRSPLHNKVPSPSLHSESMYAMSESNSTHCPSSSQQAARNPYSQAATNDSLALFLASCNLPVPILLKRPAECPVEPNRWRKHGEYQSNSEACPRLQIFRLFS